MPRSSVLQPLYAGLPRGGGAVGLQVGDPQIEPQYGLEVGTPQIAPQYALEVGTPIIHQRIGGPKPSALAALFRSKLKGKAGEPSRLEALIARKRAIQDMVRRGISNVFPAGMDAPPDSVPVSAIPEEYRGKLPVQSGRVYFKDLSPMQRGIVDEWTGKAPLLSQLDATAQPSRGRY